VKLPRLLTSPLAATAGVVAGLALLAVPLHQLTSAPQARSVPPPTAPAAREVPAWLTLKLLAPAKSVSLKSTSGRVLWEAADIAAGDVETQAALPIDRGELDLTLDADFGDNPAETAVFLTLAPDGLDEQTRHAIGRGRIEEALRFNWPAR
jgi:uncharacterized protein (DUF58 family)